MTEHKNLSEAFLAAKAEFLEIPKDRENPHFKSRYSTLDAIHTATNPSLLKHGLSAYHSTPLTDGVLTVTAVLEHATSGEKRENTMSIAVPANIQTIGSHITYLRRYTLSPLLGVCSDEDDDGNAGAAAVKDQPKQRSEPKATPPKTSHLKPAPMTPEQIAFNEWAAPLVKAGELQRDEIIRRLKESNNNYVQVRADIETAMAELEPAKA